MVGEEPAQAGFVQLVARGFNRRAYCTGVHVVTVLREIQQCHR